MAMKQNKHDRIDQEEQINWLTKIEIQIIWRQNAKAKHDSIDRELEMWNSSSLLATQIKVLDSTSLPSAKWYIRSRNSILA